MRLEDIGFYTLSDKRAETVSPVSQMQRCELIITEYCNFNCAYCRGLREDIYRDKNKKMLSFNEIKNVIDLWCKDKPLKNIRFSGGEPTIHPEIVQIIAYARMSGIKRIAISTNGSADYELYEKILNAGCNDFSVSLDACCAAKFKKFAGVKNDMWDKFVTNLKGLSKRTYVTVGVVLTPDNIKDVEEIIVFANDCSVSDIRIIPAAQWKKGLDIVQVDEDVLSKYPILKYRLANLANGKNVRGLTTTDSPACPLVIDDSVIAGDFHFPCVIYMREQGDPVGKVNENMRAERIEWFKNTDVFKDSICRKNCLDVCIDYNNKASKNSFCNK
jgi:molybdenum cofactor biosynthesis enzyme MoaA